MATKIDKRGETHEDILADIAELLFDLLAVLLSHLLLLLATLGLLLDRGDDSPRGTASSDHVLVGDREEVALLVRELSSELGHLLHGLGHVIVTLGLKTTN